MRYLKIGILLFVVCSVIPLVALAGFTGEEKFGAGNTKCIAWGDYNNDDYLDLAVGNDGQNYLYTNNGDGTFTKHPEFGSLGTVAVAWGDYDNDGDIDLAVGNGTKHVFQSNYLFINEGDGSFTKSEQFNYDLEADEILYERTFTVAWGDFDFDGDLDLAVVNRRDLLIIYTNDGNGNFPDNEEVVLGLRYAYSIAWGDYENDGDLDLALGAEGIYLSAQPNYLFINEMDEYLSEEIPFGDFIARVFSEAWGDADNDGDLDLAMGYSGAVKQNYLYVKQDDCSFKAEPNFGLLDTLSVAWGDYDKDGDLDLAVANGAWQQNFLYINEENDKNFLNIHLVGHYHDKGNGYSNRDGIGAKVLVYEAGHVGDPEHLLGFREIEANGGTCGQDSIDAEFGIPFANRLVDILVIWPGSGGTHIEEYWENVWTAQFLELNEGTGIPY